MGKALYRKYRSKSLDEIVGQGHVTAILARSIEKGRVAHAYLLTGPKGVGKTSIARILAHEINKLPYTDDTNHLDIIEIDAASNNGVEDVRDLREKVQIAPVSAQKKVYIIDEVHMLSKAAFNALLKTLEEPPEHVVFILATTDVDKLPATIISRTQRFGLRAMAKEDGVKHLRMIAEKEGIKITDEALELLVERGDGSFRNSVSLLDQIASLADEKSGITPHLVETTLGLAPHAAVKKLLSAVAAHDTQTLIAELDAFEKSGVQATVLASQLIIAIRSTIAEHPQLVTLLDGLLEVNKSSHPNIKLLTTLVGFASPKPKTAALVAPTLSISKPVSELSSAPLTNSAAPSTLPKSTENEEQRSRVGAEATPARVAASGAAPAFDKISDFSEEGADSPTGPVDSDLRGNSGGISNDGSGVEQATSESQKIIDNADSTTGELDWNKLIEYVRTNHVAIYSVLSKCGYEQQGETLRLYTNTAFYKKKLDDAKYRPLIAQSLIKTGAGELIIETIASPPPPKDSKAAAVAAIMGGGVEVNVSE